MPTGLSRGSGALQTEDERAGSQTERVSGQRRQVISHPRGGGGEGGNRGGTADSAARDSDDDDRYRCAQLVLPQGYSSSSASRRESRAESAQQR